MAVLLIEPIELMKPFEQNIQLIRYATSLSGDNAEK